MAFNLTRRAVVRWLASSVTLPAFIDLRTKPATAERSGHAEFRGCRRQPRAHPEGHRGLPRQESESWSPRSISARRRRRNCPARSRPSKDANRVDIDGVLTGIDALSAGVDQKLWIPIASEYASKLPKLDDIYLPGAKQMQALASNQGVCIVFCPAGPVIEYMPDKVKQVPTTAEELLAWAKANPNRFIYARPANSGPGRIFMMGLPYILGDKDPKIRKTAGTRRGPISRNSANTSNTIPAAPAR